LTEHSLAPPTPTDTALDAQDVTRLLDAAKSALRLLDAMDEHMPADMCFGGEARVRRELRTAIRCVAS
jgi:hypothetical protein